jgi:3-oxoacyl-[acyl-carrier-protein] synthase II
MNLAAPVAITGIGCLCASGNSLSACMESIFSGCRNAGTPVSIKSSHESRYPVFEIKGEIPCKIKDGSITYSRTSMLGLLAAKEAMADAGLDNDFVKGLKTGVIMGTTVGCTMNDEQFYRDFRNNKNPDMAPITRYLNSNPASVISGEYSLTGPCQAIVNACSSGTDAVGIGASWIRSGLCDIVIAGGADELSRISYNGFISLMITDNALCRPFDRNRKGLNLGEGSAVLVLESERSYMRRNIKPRSFVLGYGSACDGHHLTAPHPEGLGLKKAIKDAMLLSGKRWEDIAFVNAHGTATPDNDRVEAKVLKEVLPNIPFLSTKGYTGHTLGAAGAIEAAFTVACLESGRVPGNAGFTEPDPEMTVTPVENNTAISGKTAMSESLAFGGHNSAIIISIDGI